MYKTLGKDEKDIDSEDSSLLDDLPF